MGWPSSDPDARDAGFATASAMIVSLALGLMATALLGVSLEQLRLSRGDLARDKVMFALAGAQNVAAVVLMQVGDQPRLRWTVSATGDPVRMLAEDETKKLALAAAANLDAEVLTRLEIRDAGPLRQRLQALAASQGLAVADADTAPLWRACAPSLISFYGQAAKPPRLTAQTPLAVAGASHVGEIWRLRAQLGDWADDRLVRLTGDPGHPVAIVTRRLTRSGKGDAPCDALFGETL